MIEEETTVDCYECEKEVGASNPLFPFCSELCKTKWGNEHWGKKEKKVCRFKTIEDCQKKIEEMRKNIIGAELPDVTLF